MKYILKNRIDINFKKEIYMKNKIKCPNCGTIIQLDESDYNSIVSQVRNEEFESELSKKEEALKVQLNSEIELAKTKTESNFKDELSKKDKEIQDLQNKYNHLSNEAAKKVAEQKDALNEAVNFRDLEIATLKKELEMAENDKKSAIVEALAKEKENSTSKDIEIEKLKQTLKAKETEKELAISRALSDKEKEIADLNNKITINDSSYIQKETTLKSEYEAQLRAMQTEVDFYKDFKAKQSTKLIGESLEIHCATEYNKTLRPILTRAYFEKDNEVSMDSSSKGDFIFRDYDEDGSEFVSIMFEMKNETDTTSTKKANEHFFKELDKDRKEKKCEYAVLVSLLEPDSELYNAGIVDVSYQYEKMYVVRPQFFIPIITLIRNGALNSLEARRQLAIIQNQNIDISNFEDNMNKFKEAFGKNYELASRKFADAIKDIDNTIKALEKTKADLLSSDRNLRLANDKAQGLTIKKLTHNAPSVAEKFKKPKK